MVNELRIEQVSVSYGKLAAVNHVSFNVAGGEIIALLGSSGSGKSSLLRAIVGLEPLTSGRVMLGGCDITHTPVHRRGIGLMFQDGQLFEHRSVAANVSYGLGRTPRAERHQIVADMLAMVGLPDYGERPINTLSGGQAQRVALARALAPRPQVLLLDEPLSALDRELRGHLGEVLSTTLRQTQTTAVLVTHDHQEAVAVADRIGVLCDGRLLAIDTPEGLERHPPDTAVAKFLGHPQHPRPQPG